MTRKEQIKFVKNSAEDYGVPLRDALMIFDMLGESEMYDGFVTELEDYAEMIDNY